MPHMQATIKVPIEEITWQAVLCMVDVFDSEIEVCQHRTRPMTTEENLAPGQSEDLATPILEGNEHHPPASGTPIQDGIGLNSVLEDMQRQLTSLVEAVSRDCGKNESNRTILGEIDGLKQLISQAQDTTKNHLAEFQDWMVRTYDNRIQVLSRHLEAEIYCKKHLQDQLKERNVIIERVKKEVLASGGLDQAQIDELKRQFATATNTDNLMAKSTSEKQFKTPTPNSRPPFNVPESHGVKENTTSIVSAAPRGSEGRLPLQVTESDDLDMSAAVPPPPARVLRNSLLSVLRCSSEVQPSSKGTTTPPGLTRPPVVRRDTLPSNPPVLLSDIHEESNGGAIAVGHRSNDAEGKGREKEENPVKYASHDTTPKIPTGREGGDEPIEDRTPPPTGQKNCQSSGPVTVQKSATGAHGGGPSGGGQPVNPREHSQNNDSRTPGGVFRVGEVAPMPQSHCDARDDIGHGNIGFGSSKLFFPYR